MTIGLRKGYKGESYHRMHHNLSPHRISTKWLAEILCGLVNLDVA